MKDINNNNTISIDYDFILDHTSYAEISDIIEAVESTAKLYVGSILRKTKYVIKGLRNEGSIDLKEVRCVVEDSPNLDTPFAHRELRERCIHSSSVWLKY